MEPEVDQKDAPEAERKFLNAAEFIAAPDIEYKDVYIESMKAWVHMKTLSGDDMVKLNDKDNPAVQKNGDIMLVMACLVDKTTKKQLLSMDQLDQMKKKSIITFKSLQRAAMELNQLGAYSKNA